MAKTPPHFTVFVILIHKLSYLMNISWGLSFLYSNGSRGLVRNLKAWLCIWIHLKCDKENGTHILPHHPKTITLRVKLYFRRSKQ